MDGPTTRLRLRVSPGARRSEVVGRHGAGWKVRVAAPPADGRANSAVLELLASALGVSLERLELVAGRSGRDKVVAVHGLTGAGADAKLTAAGRAR